MVNFTQHGRNDNDSLRPFERSRAVFAPFFHSPNDTNAAENKKTSLQQSKEFRRELKLWLSRWAYELVKMMRSEIFAGSIATHLSEVSLDGDLVEPSA